MNLFKRLLSLVIVVTMILSIAAPAMAASANDDAPKVIFYDEDGTTVLGTFDTVAISGSDRYYVDWKTLNTIPDFNGADDKIILTWKIKGGVDERFVLSDIAARAAVVTADINSGRLQPLTADLHLVPLATMSKSEFEEIHYGSMNVDTHNDSPLRIIGTNDLPDENKDLTVIEDRPDNVSQNYYPWMQQGGLSGLAFAAYTSGSGSYDVSRGSGDWANSRILALTNATKWSADRNPDYIKLVTDSAGFREAFDEGRIGIVHTIESAYSLTAENYEELIPQYYDLGIRMISFTWNYNSNMAAGNEMADLSPYTDTKWAGMSEVGYKALDKLNEVGIVFDISHSDDQTVRDALAASDNPIIGTHSGVRNTYDHKRNLYDEELIGIARSGGAIFQNFYGEFMNEPRSVSEIVDQIDYMRDLFTAEGLDWSDHVGFGADYDGGTNNADINDARYYYRLPKELLARGYSAEEIAKLSGLNAHRIMDEVQANATLVFDGTAVITNPTAEGVLLGDGLDLAQLDTRGPVFTADVSGAESARVIVDGIVYPCELANGTITASLEETPLQEKFHVVTFEATDSNGGISRDTKIFYVGGVDQIHKVEFMDADRENLIKTIYVDHEGTIDPDDIPVEATNGNRITGWNAWRDTDSVNLEASLTKSYRFVAIEEELVKLTTDAYLIRENDYVDLDACFTQEESSNAAILTFTFDGDKFNYVDFKVADGVAIVNEDRSEAANGKVKVTLMSYKYDLENFGRFTLQAKSDYEFTRGVETVGMDVEYVLLDDEGEKTIETAYTSASFTTGDILQGDTNLDGVIDIIDLSNMIDWFGIDTRNEEWTEWYTFFDFNNNGEIDIFDIVWVAQRI